MRGVKCFEAEAARLGPYMLRASGPRVIEVSSITGTVDKCGDLDHRFRLIGRSTDRTEQRRRARLDEADLGYTILPPIDVYRIEGEYYVIDGNRRVAAAKRQKLEYMDAHVTECVPLADREAGQAIVSRQQFEQDTGLKNVQLAFETGYAVLLVDARSYPAAAADELRERARLWYSRYYRPACRSLENSPLSRRFPKARGGDLFVMVSRFYRETMGGYPADHSYETLLSGFLFANDLPGRHTGRVLRLPPFRLLLKLLVRLTQKRPVRRRAGED